MTKEEEKLIGENLGDGEIVELYWQRSERAIEETSKKYGRYLHTIAHNILHDRLDCEECVNDTYLGVWNRIPPARPNVFRVFLSKIARNISIDRFRKNHAARRVPSEMTVALEELDECVSDPETPETEYAIRAMIRVLNEFLRSLDPKNEFIFICRYYYADSADRIAQLLDVSRSTVYRALEEMRRGLKEALEKEGWKYE
ncbi:MAG: sigma-70 family RNA polymerase sigma factor [Clostridia bacterium]|nr:sigma-70 family RNA polymerase sigma factor [Clostridia bacterium]